MVRFKMLARDVNCYPTQYRTWVVDDVPDFTASLYTGPKGGDNPLEDISAYILLDDNVIADFNYPLAAKPNYINWQSTQKVLPEHIYDGQLGIIGEYVYIFGGRNSNKILRAPIGNPTNWEVTAATLPSVLSGSQLAVVGDRVYLFGGYTANTVNNIYSAPVSDPLDWVDHGPLLPRRLQNSQLAIINNKIYLFGGFESTVASAAIISCDYSDPLTWSNEVLELPERVFSSHLGIIGDSVYLFGGTNYDLQQIDKIFKANLLTPTDWSQVGTLPYQVSSGQFFTIGESGYIIAPGNTSPGVFQTKIIKAKLNSPTSWSNTGKFIPGNVASSHLAIIYDRVFLFGGNGNSTIYTDNLLFKYRLVDLPVTTYADVTRTQYDSASALDLFKVLGFPNWKTDYGS